MIQPDQLSGVDFGFLGAVGLFAFLAIVFQIEKCRSINILLAGKFALYIGLIEIFLYLEIYGGAWETLYIVSLDLTFAYLFYRIKGYYLSYLCVVIAAFNISNTLPPQDYAVYMISFQALQLMNAIWGVVDGLVDRVFARFNWFSSSYPRHN